MKIVFAKLKTYTFLLVTCLVGILAIQHYLRKKSPTDNPSEGGIARPASPVVEKSTAVTPDKVPANTPAEPDEFRSSRVFSELLIAAEGHIVSPGEAKALRHLMDDYTKAGGPFNKDSIKLIAAFLSRFPGSAYTVSLLREKAAIERRLGFFTDSVASLQSAWENGKSLNGLESKRNAEAAFSSLLFELSQLGRKQDLRSYLSEVAQRPVGGTALESIRRAKEVLWFLDHQAEQNVFCGFTAANQVCVPMGKPPIFPDAHDEAEKKEFIDNGLSLFELRAHSHESDGDLRIVKRTKPDAEVPVPSIVHWNFGHYSAITEKSGDSYRVKDFHLKFDSWVPAEAIESQASGYFMAPTSTKMPSGYAEVADAEAKAIYGRHCTHGRDDEGDDPPPNPPKCPTSPMTTYSFRLVNPGLQLFDTPTSYTPPYGPKVEFTVKYDQRSTVIPDVQQSANFGPRWTYDYLSHIDLIGTGTPSSSVWVVFGDGVYFSYSYNTATSSYTPKYLERPRLDYLAAGQGGPGYRLRYPDGSQWLYTAPNTATPTRFYLTSQKDPWGNTLALGYDGSLRLSSITDAAGLITNLSYTPQPGDQVPSDTSKIRSITDPFGRQSIFKYTALGQLASITDPIGIVSQFTYDLTGDFVKALQTPYGTTSFATGDLPGISADGRFIEATDPNGDKERVEANDFADYPAGGVDPNPAPTSVAVAGQAIPFFPKNDNLFYRNTFYWDKKQMSEYAGDYSKATIYNWKAENNVITGMLGSFKSPLSGRVWYNYTGQTSADGLGSYQHVPSAVVRSIEGPTGTPTWTMARNEYDPAYGKLRKTIDVLGRETLYEYNDSNTVPGAVQGLDLTAVKVKNGAAYEVLTSYSNFVNHQPQTVTDAAGQTTSYSWNANGQISSVTNAKNETTAYSYYSADVAGKQRKGRLFQINGPLAGNSDITTYDYDAAGRVASVTGSDGYSLSYTYDALDHPVRVIYPDSTFTETTYQALDTKTSRDRLGRITNYVYNSGRQLQSVTDPANRTVQYKWCKCGALNQLIDPMGRVTIWKRDAAGRPTYKQYADGSKISYAYQPFSGRLQSITDEKGQVKTFSYNLDDSTAALAYTNAAIATPNVSFSYDPNFLRVTAMTDGTGTTNYTYYPNAPGTLGAGQLASETSPLPNSTLTYTYDQLGRRIGYAVNGVGQTDSLDALGRVAAVTNPLGTFNYTYAGATNRMNAASLPNGMTCSYTYHPLTSDFQLKDIINTLPGGAFLSQHSYTYNAVGNITRWTQTSSGGAINRSWLCGYDGADQLTSVTSQDPTSFAMQPTGQYAYTYDPAGNRLTETIDGSTTTGSYNVLNQLGTLTSGGAAVLPLQTYEWDAENRLTVINYTGTNQRSEFSYDGLGRRIRIAERTNGVLQGDSRYVWCGNEICEVRDSGGANVARRLFKQGEVLVGSPNANLYYIKDHLGSVREAVDTNGMPQTRYGYDAFGRRSVLQESLQPVFGFTSDFSHQESGLHLTWFRALDSASGRWLSRDPLEELAGANLYAYVNNNPINAIDPLGLQLQSVCGVRPPPPQYRPPGNWCGNICAACFNPRPMPPLLRLAACGACIVCLSARFSQ